ncbi:TetR/AcrR family transcriptional regulator [Bacillus sp. 1P06AnD]|uniref:TetR/AcrR family transcriptional regulator n=1 Tax=Bacillus sp. 1P06AnD TaxID=3132208 RepID=UPI0039A057C1
MNTKAAQKRQKILEAAKEYILNNDFQSLTLDATARQAGISKGGLLYHFPNKEALLNGLADYILQNFTKAFEDHAKNDVTEKGRWSRALIETTKKDIDQHAELNVGIIAASMLHTDLSGNISEAYQYMQTKVEQDGLDPVAATIIRLAIDGLYYSELFQIAPLDPHMQEKVIERLKLMTQ